jgi:gamma-glutamylputrescine oxidase
MSTTQLSVWEKESFFAPADIIIAGSGLVGLWSAYYLKKAHPSISITIVDRGIIPTGASTRNAGFACFGSLTELVADAAKMGEDKMLELVEMRYRGIKRIAKIFSDKETGFERFGGYELITDNHSATGTPSSINIPSPGSGDSSSVDTHPQRADSPQSGDSSEKSDPAETGNPSESNQFALGMDINQLRSHIDWLNRRLKKIVKEQKTFRLQHDKLAEFGFAGIQHLIENKAEAQLHSGKLCQALLRLVQSMGVNVLNNIEIKSFEKVNGHLLLQTDQPFSLTANQLLVCTNAFARQLLPQLDIEPARGQVLVTSPIDNLPFKGTFHFEEGFYYFRDLGDRVLLGGARNKAFAEETTTDMTISDTIQQELERFLREVVLPGRPFTIEHRWSGIMGMGSEKIPIIRQINDQVFCAVRMSGMGVALAPMIGEKIAEMMSGNNGDTN